MKREGVCVFTDRKKKAIAFALVPVIAINVYAGCKMLTKTSKNILNEPSTSIEQVVEEIPGETYLELDESKLDVEIVDESQLSQDINGDIILDKVIDEETDFTKLDKIYKESRLDIDTILKNEMAKWKKENEQLKNSIKVLPEINNILKQINYKQIFPSG